MKDYCKIHNQNKNLMCFDEKCTKKGLMCTDCMFEYHRQHQFMPVNRFLELLLNRKDTFQKNVQKYKMENNQSTEMCVKDLIDLKKQIVQEIDENIETLLEQQSNIHLQIQHKWDETNLLIQSLIADDINQEGFFQILLNKIQLFDQNDQIKIEVDDFKSCLDMVLKRKCVLKLYIENSCQKNKNLIAFFKEQNQLTFKKIESLVSQKTQHSEMNKKKNDGQNTPLISLSQTQDTHNQLPSSFEDSFQNQQPFSFRSNNDCLSDTAFNSNKKYNQECRSDSGHKINQFQDSEVQKEDSIEYVQGQDSFFDSQLRKVQGIQFVQSITKTNTQQVEYQNQSLYQLNQQEYILKSSQIYQNQSLDLQEKKLFRSQDSHNLNSTKSNQIIPQQNLFENEILIPFTQQFDDSKQKLEYDSLDRLQKSYLLDNTKIDVYSQNQIHEDQQESYNLSQQMRLRNDKLVEDSKNKLVSINLKYHHDQNKSQISFNEFKSTTNNSCNNDEPKNQFNLVEQQNIHDGDQNNITTKDIQNQQKNDDINQQEEDIHCQEYELIDLQHYKSEKKEIYDENSIDSSNHDNNQNDQNEQEKKEYHDQNINQTINQEIENQTQDCQSHQMSDKYIESCSSYHSIPNNDIQENQK